MPSTETESCLSGKEMERYKRQLMHRGFTPEHQARIKTASALVAGIGGLGGAAATYLAVAGIGRLRIAHYGTLTLSNMNRQTLMMDERIGESRVLQAKDRIKELNPHVEVEIINERISDDNIGVLLDGIDIALSARPNFSERRTLNRGCVKGHITMIEAAMNGMEGYLLNVVPEQTPCLECLYPEDNPEWEELGFPVLGAVSGMLGCIMAIEAIKLLTGYGRPILSQMLVFNTFDMEYRKFRVRRNYSCPVCGNRYERIRGVSELSNAYV
jgi:molybdopterin/thiamine biosynthesis adenylyltransferase